MPKQPQVYLIHADDAPQHQARLQQILQQLQAEQRISNFHTLHHDAVNGLEDQIRPRDLVLTLLTYGLEPSRNHLEPIIQALKVEQPQVKVAEVVVDNLPYNNEFITFPADLHPIRSREDMDAVWKEIEQNLKMMFPVQQAPSPEPSPSLFASIVTKTNIIVLTTTAIALLTPIYAHHDLFGFALVAVLIIHIIGLIIVFRSAQSSTSIKTIFISTMLIGIWGLMSADRDEDIVPTLLIIAGINFIGLFLRKREKVHK